MGPFGWKEILFVAFIIILLFGAKKLPELARGIGKSIKEFKKATNEEDEDESNEKNPDVPKNGATGAASKADTASKN